jgi:hypothetical protein
MFLNTYFLSVLNCLLLIAGCSTKMVGGGTRTRRGRGRRRRSTCRTEEEAQQDDAVQQQVEQQAAVDAAQQDDDDAAQQDDDDDAAQQDVSGSGSSGSRNVYLRGPASLPQRPILRDRRPLIRPDGGEVGNFRCCCCFFILYVQINNRN